MTVMTLGHFFFFLRLWFGRVDCWIGVGLRIFQTERRTLLGMIVMSWPYLFGMHSLNPSLQKWAISVSDILTRPTNPFELSEHQHTKRQGLDLVGILR